MGVDVFDALDISIHALRKESDYVSVRTIAASPYFNPRSP